MAGIRKGFARVDALTELLKIVAAGEGLDKVTVTDGYTPDLDGNEFIFPGVITGPISQPVSRAGRSVNDDEFTIPLHVGAWNADAQQDAATARARCQTLMDAVYDAVAEHANVKVAGGLYMILTGADGPDLEPVKDPSGWAADGVVRVFIRARMK